MEDRGETYDAIRASLRLLDDPFTRFLDPDRYAALKRGNAGTVTGVGLEVGFSNESGRNRMVVRLFHAAASSQGICKRRMTPTGQRRGHQPMSSGPQSRVNQMVTLCNNTKQLFRRPSCACLGVPLAAVPSPE